MLTIHEINCPPADAKRYYAAADYYSQGQETVGDWFGKLAERLGLSGKVRKDDFDRMVDNLRPDGSPLSARHKDNRRIGYDFTVSDPKSASLLRAFARDDIKAMLATARKQAVTGLLSVIEADMQTRVRKDGRDENRLTGNLACSVFDHSTARPVDGQAPDPHTHSHLVVFNATFDAEEQRVKAGQFGDLKRDGEYYAAVFDSLYAAELVRLGFAVERKGGKDWEIAGVPQSMIGTFSKRTVEIEDKAAREGIINAAEKAGLGAKTRSRKKKELTPGQLEKAWDGQLTPEERAAMQAVYRGEAAGTPAVTAAEAVSYAVSHCGEKQAAFPLRKLVAEALWFGLGHVGEREIMAELPRQGVIVAEIDGRRMATTAELQAEERYISGFAASGRGSVRPMAVPEGLSRTLAGGKRLNDGQWEAALGLIASENRLNLLHGPAGSGKSWLLAKLDEAVGMNGGKVTYLASSSDAAGLLAKDGLEAHTVARFLVDTRMQEAARGGRVVVDETSMLGHKSAYRLLKLAETLGLQLVMVGDPAQHGSVDRGDLMRLLKDYGGLTPYRLTEIMRQDDAGYREAARLMSEGKTLAGWDAIDGKGWVRELEDAAGRYREIAAEYRQALDDGKTVLCVSPTHREAAQATEAIRHELRQAGRLGAEERAFTRLAAVDTTEAERGQRSTYCRDGLVLQYHQNAKGVRKGERREVTDADAVPLADAGKFSLYRREAIRLSVGDKIRFTGTVKAEGGRHVLRNGMTRTVAGFTAAGGILLDNGWKVAADAGHFRSGWVETSFGAQGKTVQRAIVAVAAESLPAASREMAYVAATRARERVSFYTDDKDAVRFAIGRDARKVLALELPEAEKPKPAGLSMAERAKRHLSKLRSLSVIGRMRAAWERSRSQPMAAERVPAQRERQERGR